MAQRRVMSSLSPLLLFYFTFLWFISGSCCSLSVLLPCVMTLLKFPLLLLRFSIVLFGALIQLLDVVTGQCHIFLL